MVRRQQIKKKSHKAKTATPKSPLGRGEPRVLVLGVTGMLGSAVFRYLKEQGFLVAGTARDPHSVSFKGAKIFSFDASSPILAEESFKSWKPDFVINCIGIIKPYCKDDDPKGVLNAVNVNAFFPHKLAGLAEKFGFRVIQIATDCVYSGKKGNYVENDFHDAVDVYGKTKSLGEVRAETFLHLRTSIIGPEEKGKLSLLEWFLSQQRGGVVKGFAHHRWNGITTLQFAELTEKIIKGGAPFFDKLAKDSHVHHVVLNESVDKYELMKIFEEAFGLGVTIERVDNIGPAVDRTLATNFKSLWEKPLIPMREAVSDLVVYMRKHKLGPYV